MTSTHVDTTTTSPSNTAPGPRVGRSGTCHSGRYKWWILSIGIGAQAAFSAAFQGIPISGSLIQTGYHLSVGQLGFVLAAVSFGVAVTDVAWGALADRIGERKVLVTGLSGTTAALAGVTAFLVPTHGHAPAYWALAVGLFAAGALGGCVNGASGRAVMGWFPVTQRGLAISLRVASVPAGGAVGAAILPPLILNGGFRWMFGTLTALCLIATAAVAIWLDEPPLARSGGSGTATPDPLRRPDIWRIALTAFLLNLPQFTVLTFGAVFLAGTEHLSVATIAVLLVVVQALGGASRIAGGRWTDRRGGRYRRRLVTVYSWLMAAGFVATAFYPVLPVAVVATLIVVAGSLACGWHGVHYAEIATMAGAERAGAALGLENTMVFGGAFAAPLLIPTVLSLTSWSGVMVAIGAVPAVAAAVLMPRELRVMPSDAGR